MSLCHFSLCLFSVALNVKCHIILLTYLFKLLSLNKNVFIFAVIQSAVYFLSFLQMYSFPFPAQFLHFLFFFVIFLSCLYLFFSRPPYAQLCTCVYTHTNTCAHSPRVSVLVVILTSSRNRIMGRGPLTWGRRKCEI